MATLPDFRTLWLGYPRGSSTEVKAKIGGQVNYDWITNTCTIRTSHAFNYSGVKVPKGYDGLGTTAGADGLRYAYRVREFRRWLEAIYGPPTHRVIGKAGSIEQSAFADRQGLICFEVAAWEDATGHFDMWDGSRAVAGAYFEQSHQVAIWEAATTSDPFSIERGVGRGLPNRAADVKVVQTLLNLAVADAGKVDGDCGPKTLYAIERFQKWYDLPPDKVVNPDGVTFRKLTQPD